jgi:nicotinamidase/pyrazinamidase
MTKIILHKDRTASIDVHAQYTFTPECPNELPVPHGTEIVHELNAQAKFARYRIGSKEAHHSHAIWIAKSVDEQLTPIKGANVDVKWVPHSIVGTKGFHLIGGLPPISNYDYFVWEGIELDMHPYGVCYHDHNEKLSTGLIEFLRCHQVDTAIVGGLATDYCVKVSTLQLLKAGFKTLVNLGACRGLTIETTKKAIDEVKDAGAIIFDSVNDLHLDR